MQREKGIGGHSQAGHFAKVVQGGPKIIAGGHLIIAPRLAGKDIRKKLRPLENGPGGSNQGGSSFKKVDPL